VKLRDYQERAVTDLVKRVAAPCRVVAVSPTGSGKSVIGAAVVQRIRGKRVLWVAHRRELLRQARTELLAAGVPESDVGILSGTDKDNAGARVLVASIGLAARDVPSADLVVIDEAHRAAAATYRHILGGQLHVLGLTATPWRLDGTPMGDVFNEMLVVASQEELIADGWLARPETYGIPRDKMKTLGLRRGKSDYTGASLDAASKRTALVGDVVKETQRLAAGRQTLVFAVNRAHGQKLAAAFKRAGRAVAYLDGETPSDERDRITSELRDGMIQIVVNVDVLSEGFDCPLVSCIAIARPTRSRTRFLQYCGRAARIVPGNKRRAIILDHAGNCYTHLLPGVDYAWSLDGGAERETGEEPNRQCAECERMIPLSCKTCPHCAAEQPATKRERQEAAAHDADLERLAIGKAEREAIRGRLVEVAARRRLPKEWIDQVIRELPGAHI
jgi:superfamily II DNA or RNA helicase